MTTSNTSAARVRKPLRLWPGVALAIVQWLLRGGIPLVASGVTVFEVPLELAALLGAIACGLGILIWWLFFSRAPWVERIGAIVLMIVGGVATYQIVHPSIAGAHMGLMLPLYSIPVVTMALVVWAAVTRHLSDRVRRAWLIAAVVLAYAPFTLLRTAGVHGGGSELHWRWTPTPEERLLAQAGDEPTLTPQPGQAATSVPPDADAATQGGDAESRTRATADTAVPAVEPAGRETAGAPTAAAADGPFAPSEWPGFRGPARDSVVRGLRIDTDWSKSPPVEVWRRPIGPGWSSFAVQGDFVFTQEQRGEDEIVACYRIATGEPVWRHRDPVRFYESNAGPGPRATPAVHGGRVYSIGATGLLNALDARTGARLWSRNAADDTGKTIPPWGIAGSPLALDDLVIAGVAGQLAAYDARTGAPRWIGRRGGGGYSSPHAVTIAGVPQVLLMTGSRTISVAPADGTLLWEHQSGESDASIVQPALAANGDLLLPGGDAMGGAGISRVAVSRTDGGWTLEQRWASRGLKPYFNDFVVHEGHAYGFDGSILAAIDLTDGSRKWKGGRYGNGQLVLLAEQDVLLVISEEGQLALVSATPDKFTEIARLQALHAKTWNHPVLVRDLLLVRNGEEMAAFRLSVKGQ